MENMPSSVSRGGGGGKMTWMAGEGEGLMKWNRREISRFARNDGIFVVDACGRRAVWRSLKRRGAGSLAVLDVLGWPGLDFRRGIGACGGGLWC